MAGFVNSVKGKLFIEAFLDGGQCNKQLFFQKNNWGMACSQAGDVANAAWCIMQKYKKCYKKGVDRSNGECYYIQVAEMRRQAEP